MRLARHRPLTKGEEAYTSCGSIQADDDYNDLAFGLKSNDGDLVIEQIVNFFEVFEKTLLTNVLTKEKTITFSRIQF